MKIVACTDAIMRHHDRLEIDKTYSAIGRQVALRLNMIAGTATTLLDGARFALIGDVRRSLKYLALLVITAIYGIILPSISRELYSAMGLAPPPGIVARITMWTKDHWKQSLFWCLFFGTVYTGMHVHQMTGEEFQALNGRLQPITQHFQGVYKQLDPRQWKTLGVSTVSTIGAYFIADRLALRRSIFLVRISNDRHHHYRMA